MYHGIVGGIAARRDLPTPDRPKAKYHKLKAYGSALCATLAIAHKILIAAYHMPATNQTYKDLGEDHLNHVDETRFPPARPTPQMSGLRGRRDAQGLNRERPMARGPPDQGIFMAVSDNVLTRSSL